MGIMGLPLWAKILGPIVLAGLLFAAVTAWGHSKYNAGHKDGVSETDAKWEKVKAELKAAAEKSATRADDAAVKRLEEFEQQAEDDQKAVDDAKANDTSALDALFG